jgi:hypothetical protein
MSFDEMGNVSRSRRYWRYAGRHVYEDTVFPLARDGMLMDRRELGALTFLAALSHNEVEQEIEQ